MCCDEFSDGVCAVHSTYFNLLYAIYLLYYRVHTPTVFQHSINSRMLLVVYCIGNILYIEFCRRDTTDFDLVVVSRNRYSPHHILWYSEYKTTDKYMIRLSNRFRYRYTNTFI